MPRGSVENTDADFPVEFLNTIVMSGLPPHKLILKLGMPVMLIRNIKQEGAANGTRAIVRGMHDKLLDLELVTGPAAGPWLYVPRVPMTSSDFRIAFQVAAAADSYCASTCNEHQ